MTTLFKRKRFAFITFVYWFLLVYVIAALVWWYIALIKQNDAMVEYEIKTINREEPGYELKRVELEKERKRKITQYNGEGVTFLILILVGAVFVYRAVRRQIRLSGQQRNFMMAVTHELKTPIAVAKLNLETLKKRKLDLSIQEQLIQNTLQEASRLNDLVDNILLASELESGGYEITYNRIPISELAEHTVQEFRQRFPERKIGGRIGGNAFILGDLLLIRLAIHNLLENALKYSPAEKMIAVNLNVMDKAVELQVKDEGAGIPDPEKKNIFDKFYRVGSEITRQRTGTGLGLYLVKKICEDHRASITVTDNTPSGSIFTIRFNKSDS